MDVRDLIIDKLKEMERSVRWLHKKTNIPYGTLYDCLVRKGFNLSASNIEKIDNILETNFKSIHQ